MPAVSAGDLRPILDLVRDFVRTRVVPQELEIADRQTGVMARRAVVRDTAGVVADDGRMVDKPVLDRARHILRQPQEGSAQ